MFSSSNLAGRAEILVTLTILVILGSALATIADRRFARTRNDREMKMVLADGEEQLEALRDRHAFASKRVAAGEAEAGKEESAFGDVMVERDRLRDESFMAQERLGRLLAEADDLDERYAAYREAFRSRTWRAAEGLHVPVLNTRNGRSYQDVYVLRITRAGAEIRHEGGLARLSPADCPKDWQERFQWSQAERDEILKEERRNWIAHRGMEDEEGDEGADDERVDEVVLSNFSVASGLREETARLRMQVTILRAQLGTANFYSRHGRHKEVVQRTGETWGARTQRLALELFHAERRHDRARERLAKLVKADPLLLPLPWER